MIEKAQCRSRSEIRNDEKVRNIEWWYGMMIWNDDKREMELMNVNSGEKREK